MSTLWTLFHLRPLVWQLGLTMLWLVVLLIGDYVFRQEDRRDAALAASHRQYEAVNPPSAKLPLRWRKDPQCFVDAAKAERRARLDAMQTDLIAVQRRGRRRES